MYRAAGQGSIGRVLRYMVLISQLAAEQCGLICVQVRQHHRHRFVPPGQCAQIGLMAAVILPGQMHACQHVAHGRAMHGLGGQLALAFELVDHRSGFAADGVQDVAIRVGCRVGHGNALAGQVLHQVQVKRQLVVGQALEQREHILALVGADKVIRVFDAPLNAAQRSELPQLEKVHQFARLGFGNFGENRHGNNRERAARPG